MKPQAILCDRDGTLIQDKHFLDSPENIEWIPGVLSTLKQLKQSEVKILVITNQSGVARGYFGTDAVEAIHEKMRQDVEQIGGEIADFYYCPHHPEGIVSGYNHACNCRKPAPGLLIRAIQEHHLNPQQCWVVGDRLRDLQPGINLGMTSFLVATGYGRKEVTQWEEKQTLSEIKMIASFPKIIDGMGIKNIIEREEKLIKAY